MSFNSSFRKIDLDSRLIWPYFLSMKTEIERKFLVIDTGFKNQVSKLYNIIQDYLNKDSERTIRVREK